MNPFGSYRALVGNATAAMSAAVEVYNKPRMAYREECCVILLVNAWELLLKAILSKRKVRIYYKKARNQPYRTLSVKDALNRAESFFPQSVDYRATAHNLELLVDYRDAAIHFYNRAGFGALIYALAQTSIVNFRDLVEAVFQRDIAREFTLSLLPLALAPPVDPIEFLRGDFTGPKESKAVKEFTQRVRDLVVSLETEGHDTGRLLTRFTVHLISTKKISSADIVAGVEASAGGSGMLLVQRPTDPNKTHPYREVNIVGRKGDPKKPGLGLKIGNRPVGQFQFRALVHAYDVKNKSQYCWSDETGAVTRYSPALVEFISRLTEADLDEALRSYRARRREVG